MSVGKASGEQARRGLMGLNTPAAKSSVLAALSSYEGMSHRRDIWRVIHALRGMANRLESEAKGASPRLKIATTEGVAITDHALVRFLERGMGIDVEAIRSEMLRLIPTGEFPAPAQGDVEPRSIYSRDGLHFLLTKSSVVSVLGPGMSVIGWLNGEES